MSVTLEQRIEVFNMLDAEAIKADRAVNKAQKEYEIARRYPESTTYEMAQAMLHLRVEQRAMALKIAGDYFDTYIKNEV